MTAASPPPPARVPGNRWDRLDVPEVGAWTPSLRVSVVLPYYEAPDALALTLAALAEQTYPAELTEVIVADDGSDPPLERPDGFDELDLKVVHQEDRGFGLARARNTGAKQATGDVLVFLDCDMVPEPQHLEAHARWHHAAADAVTLGFRQHVEFDGIAVEDVRAAAKAGDLARLFEGRDVQRPEWIEGHMVRTSDLTSADDDLFRIVTGGNLGMRAETYWRVGGSDESFTQWGAEDTEMGFRLFVDGALLVPERRAMCWHQGHGHVPEPHEVESLEQQRAKLSHLIAHRGFRSGAAGRSFAVPRLAVRIDGTGVPRDELVPAVEAVLGGAFHDLVVLLTVPDDHPDAVWLHRQFGPDPRVAVAPEPVVHPNTPYVADAPPTAVAGRDAMGRLVAMLEDTSDPVGVVHVTVPGSDQADTMIHARSTRAIRRAQRVLAGDDAPDPAVVEQLAGELFGERWVSGADVGVHARGTEPMPEGLAAPGGGAGRGAQAGVSTDDMQQAWQLFSTLEPDQRQVVLSAARDVLGRTTPRQRSILVAVAKRLAMLVTALASLVKARRPRAVVSGLGQVLKAILPWSVFVRLRDLRRRLAP